MEHQGTVFTLVSYSKCLLLSWDRSVFLIDHTSVTFAQAIRLYQNCLKKFHGGRDPSLHIYLAHAYFDARQYSDCKRVLLEALHLSPNNLQLWYNLALTRETFAVAVLQKEQKGEARTLSEVENAIEDLKVGIYCDFPLELNV